jgi:hypothetical protein
VITGVENIGEVAREEEDPGQEESDWSDGEIEDPVILAGMHSNLPLAKQHELIEREDARAKENEECIDYLLQLGQETWYRPKNVIAKNSRSKRLPVSNRSLKARWCPWLK